MVFASSVAVFTAAGGTIGPEATAAPTDGYGLSKWVGEDIVAGFSGEATILRLAQTVHVDVPYRPDRWEFSADQEVEYVDAAHVVDAVTRAVSGPLAGPPLTVSGGRDWQRTGAALAAAFEEVLPGRVSRFSPTPCAGIGWYPAERSVTGGEPLAAFLDQMRARLLERAVAAAEQARR